MEIKELNDLIQDKKSLYITLLLSLFYILPLLIANVYYSDDHSRILYGHGWNHDARFINDWITKITSFSKYTFSLYPYSLVFSAFLLGFSGYVLCELWGIEKGKKVKWSSLLLLISPFYLSNLPYRYDVLFMSLSIFFMIIPFAFFDNKKKFVALSSICFFLTLGLFQPSITIFFAVGIVYLTVFIEKNELKSFFVNALFFLISFIIGYTFYHLTKSALYLGINDDRMEFIFFESNFKELLINKLLTFYEICKLLYDTNYYYILVVSFLILPLIAAVPLFLKNNNILYILKIITARVTLIIIALVLVIGPNLFIKADYLPLRALPGLGVFIFTMIYFSRDLQGVFFKLFRVLVVLNTLFCFNLMAQTSNALQFQKEYQEMFVYDLNAVVRTYDIKKLMFKGDISYARKSFRILEQFPFIKTVVLKEIGQNAWFSKDVISFSGLQEQVEFIPYQETAVKPELVFKTYVYNLYKIEEGSYLLEFN